MFLTQGTFSQDILQDFFEKDAVTIDFEQQIKILISSIEDDLEREQIFKYWKTQKRDKEYDESSFFDDLIDNKTNINFKAT